MVKAQLWYVEQRHLDSFISVPQCWPWHLYNVYARPGPSTVPLPSGHKPKYIPSNGTLMRAMSVARTSSGSTAYENEDQLVFVLDEFPPCIYMDTVEYSHLSHLPNTWTLSKRALASLKCRFLLKIGIYGAEPPRTVFHKEVKTVSGRKRFTDYRYLGEKYSQTFHGLDGGATPKK